MAAAYDVDRARVVVLDRSDGTVTEWDGASGQFTQVAPVVAVPRSIAIQAATYDSVRKKTISYGWDDQGANCWEWDAPTSTWTDRTPSSIAPAWPEESDWPVMVSDPTRGRVLTFSGVIGNSLPSTNHDLYEWDGAADRWTFRTPIPRPSSWPSDRHGYAAAVDVDRNVLVLFGGASATSAILDDLWEMDLSSFTWTNRTPATLPSTWPTARGGHQLVFDSVRHHILMFGGASITAADRGTLWEWDGTAGTWIAASTSDGTTAFPVARGSFAMVYDGARGRLVMFGGDGPSLLLGDLWEWDSTTGLFSNRTPAPLPPSWPRANNMISAAYDPNRQVMVMFSGDQTWEWDGRLGVWSQRASTTVHPGARSNAGMAYDTGRKRVVLYGGEYSADPDEGRRDTWEYDGTAAD
jgi:hypothetical protein